MWDLKVHREEQGPQEQCPHPVSLGYHPWYVDTVCPLGSVTCRLTGLSFGSAGLSSDPRLTLTHRHSSGTRHGSGTGHIESLPLPLLAALPGQWDCDPAPESCQEAVLPIPACLLELPSTHLMAKGDRGV